MFKSLGGGHDGGGGWRKRGGEREVAEMEHLWSERRGERGSLHVEIPEHGVGAPATDELDDVGVDAGAEEGHGTGRAQGARFHVAELEAKGLAVFGDGFTEESGDRAYAKVMASATGVPRMEGGVRRGSILSKMKEATDDSEDRAEVGVSAASVANLFAGNGVLLQGKGKNGVRGGVEFVCGGGGWVELVLTNVEIHVHEAKR